VTELVGFEERTKCHDNSKKAFFVVVVMVVCVSLVSSYKGAFTLGDKDYSVKSPNIMLACRLGIKLSYQ